MQDGTTARERAEQRRRIAEEYAAREAAGNGVGDLPPTVDPDTGDKVSEAEQGEYRQLFRNVQYYRDTTPDLSDGEAMEIDTIIANLQKGIAPFSENGSLRDFTAEQPGWLKGLGYVGGALNFGVGLVTGGINQAGMAAEASPFSITSGDARSNRPANQPGFGGLVSSMGYGSTPDRIDANQAYFGDDSGTVEALRGLPDFNVPDFVPGIGGWNSPDTYTMVNFGLSVATDPLTFASKPVVAATRWLDDAGRAIDDVANFTGQATRQTQGTLTLAAGRAGAEENAIKLLDNARSMPASVRTANGLTDNVVDQALKSLREGNIWSLVDDARRGVGGLNMRQLHDLGVGTKWTVLGTQVAGSTRPFSTVFGALRWGKLVDEAAGLQLPARLGQLFRGLTGEATGDFADASLRDSLAAGRENSYLANLSQKLLLRQVGARVPQLFSDGTESLTYYLKDTPWDQSTKLGRQAIKELDRNIASTISGSAKVRGFIEAAEAGLKPAVGSKVRGIAKLVREERSSAETHRSMMENIVAFAHERGLSIREMTPETMKDFIVDGTRANVLDIDPAKALGREVQTIPLDQRLMTGLYVNALQKLDGLTMDAVERGVYQAAELVEGAARGSFTPAALVGSETVVAGGVRGALINEHRTLRDFISNVAVMEKASEAFRTGSMDAMDSVWRFTRSTAEALDAQGFKPGSWLNTDLGVPGYFTKAETAEAVRRLQNVMTAEGRTIPIEIQQQLAQIWSPEMMTKLNAGDMEDVALSLWRVADIGTRSRDRLRPFIDDIIKSAETNADLPFAGQKRSVANLVKETEEAIAATSSLKAGPITIKEAPKETIERVRQRVADALNNSWWNPRLLNEDDLGPEQFFNLFTKRQRADMHVLARYKPANLDTKNQAFFDLEEFAPVNSLRAEFEKLDQWMVDWTTTAQRGFELYDIHLPADMARFAKSLDTWYYNAQMRLQKFGGDAWDSVERAAAGGMDSNPRPELTALRGSGSGLTEDEARSLIRSTMNLSYDHLKDDAQRGTVLAGGRSVADLPPADFFGGINASSKISESATGEIAQQWSEELLEVSNFISSLSRAHFGTFQPLVDLLARTRRLWSSQITALPGFSSNNAKGALIMNHLRGVRTTGPGGYREWKTNYDFMRAALAQEADGALRNKASPLWEKIGAEDLDIMQQIGYSGQITASQGAGMLDQIFSPFEVSMGRFGRRPLELMENLGARSEAATVPITRWLAERDTLLPKWTANSFRNNAAGLQASTRETTEGYLRGALIFSLMKKDGMSLDAALSVVARTHFDYWDFTNVGRLVNEFMPFWLFRTRMAQTTIEMMASTPGMINQIGYLKQQDGEGDPFGWGSAEGPYVVGATFNPASAFSYAFSVMDPREAGLEDIYKIANSGILEDPLDVMGWGQEILDENVRGNLSTLPSFFTDILTNTRSGPSGSYIDEERLVRYNGGLVARLAREFDALDERAEAIANYLYLPDPPDLVNILKLTGHVTRREGQLYITQIGEDALTDFVPIIGKAEQMLAFALQAERNPNNPLSEKELSDRAKRQSWNAFSSNFGFVIRLTSPDQRYVGLKAINDEFEELWEARQASTDIMRMNQEAVTNALKKNPDIFLSEAIIRDPDGG